MKFAYADIATEQYNGQRWYMTPDGPMPSITTVLSHTEPREKVISLERWRNSLGHAEADAVTKAAADRGTVVHLLAERYLKGWRIDMPIEGKPVSPEDLGTFNALKLKLNKISEVWGQEVALFSTSLGVAGRCDLICVYDGTPAIVDFKTSRRIKSRSDITNYEEQILFYATAHNEMFQTDISRGVILMVADTGFPLVFDVDLTDEKLKERLKNRVDLFYKQVLDTIEFA